MLFRVSNLISVCLNLICIVNVETKTSWTKREICPFQPENPNGQPTSHNPAQINQRTPVNQAIRIREPVDRPPELPRTHPIQFHQPPPRQERQGLWQRVRGNGRAQEDKNKGKGKEKMEEESGAHSSSKLGKRKREQETTPAANDHEAGPSGTKPPEPKKKKGVMRRVIEGALKADSKRQSRSHHRSSNQRKRDAKEGEALLGIIGAGVYHTYRGARAVVNGVKDGCNAACRMARERATRLRDRVFRRPRPRQEIVQIHPSTSSIQTQSSNRSSGRSSSTQFHVYHAPIYHPAPLQAHIGVAANVINPIHYSASSSSSSHQAEVTSEESTNRHDGYAHGIPRQLRSGSHSQGHSARTSSSDMSSASSRSRSRSVSSRRSASHTSGSAISRGSSVSSNRSSNRSSRQ